MDAPPVQYVTTSDGFDIAYTVSGEGRPLFWTPAHFNHVGLDWYPGSVTRHWVEALSERFQVIHYDSRGQGMSTRGLPQDHSMSDYERDLEAVVQCTGLQEFILFGFLGFGQVAIRYAVKHPERVEALVLLNCRVDGTASVMIHLMEIARRDWEGFLDVSSRTTSGREESIFAKHRTREAVNQADFLLQTEVISKSSVREDAGRLSAPTLLLAVRAASWSFGAESEARRLAALIPDSRLALFDDVGAGMAAPAGETPPNIVALEAFLAEIAARPVVDKTAVPLASAELSPREVDVLRLIVAGKSSREIGDSLVLSVRTVERHIANIYLKTDTHGRAQVTAYALQRGLS